MDSPQHSGFKAQDGYSLVVKIDDLSVTDIGGQAFISITSPKIQYKKSYND
ncbi:MAG: hypothetical protein IPF93_16765 [Saprospiraceae bacterium]|nr:hypothetical protein [Saprospiraceae bacterium]